MLTFTFGNAKIPGWIAIFSLPAGHTCPGADKCLSRANRVTGKLTDGSQTEFRCYAASQEANYPQVRESRWNNFTALRGKTKQEMIKVIEQSLPKAPIVRIHASGDFFSQSYFDAWLYVAKKNPNQIFYGYTKSLQFFAARKNQLPKNFRFVASRGGKFDSLIDSLRLRFAEVIYTIGAAKRKKLKIDKDDSSVYKSKENIGLLIHGNQPAKSKASIAWQKIKTTIGGYNRSRKENI